MCVYIYIYIYTSDLVRDTHSNTYYVRVRGMSLCVVCMCECAAKASARADLREETESALRRQRILGFFPKLSLSFSLVPPFRPRRLLLQFL